MYRKHIPMKKNIFTLFLCFLLIQINIVHSQPIASARVVTEEDDKKNVACKTSHESASAAIKSALRYNRVEIVPSTETGNVNFYMTITNTEVNRESCSVGIYMQVHFYTYAKMPQSGKAILLKGELCNRSATGYLEKNSMQDRVNATLKSYVDECLAQIEKDLSK